MLYPKWMEKLSQQDTKMTRAQRKKEFWYTMEIAGLWMNWDPKYYVFNFIYIAILLSSLLYYLPCFIMTMINVDSLAAKGQYLNFVSLVIISLSMMLTFQLRRKYLVIALAMNARGFYSYGDTLGMEEIEKMEQRFSLFKKILLVVIPVWLLLIGGSVIGSPYVDAVFQYETTVHQKYINGVYQNLPLKMWYFHSIDSEFVSGMICATALAMSIGSTNLFLIFFGQTLIIQMRTLIVAIRDTDIRADRHYTSTTGQKPPSVAKRRENAELMRSYNFCLKQTMEHHKVILYFFELYRDTLNWPCGTSVMTGAILLGMSAISLMQGGGQPNYIFTGLLLLVAEMCSLFLLCEIGQTITNMGEEMFHTMYQIQWMDCNKELISNMMIMRSRMAKPMFLIGVLSQLNRDMFSKMLNSAYSYINLVRASVERNAA